MNCIEAPTHIVSVNDACNRASVDESFARGRIVMCDCVGCGQRKPAWRERGKLCIECNELKKQRVKESAKRSNQRKRERATHNRANGLCGCGRPLVFTGTCEKCHDTMKKNYKNYRDRKAQQKASQEIQ